MLLESFMDIDIKDTNGRCLEKIPTFNILYTVHVFFCDTAFLSLPLDFQTLSLSHIFGLLVNRGFYHSPVSISLSLVSTSLFLYHC